jgi:hypothetical protein
VIADSPESGGRQEIRREERAQSRKRRANGRDSSIAVLASEFQINQRVTISRPSTSMSSATCCQGCVGAHHSVINVLGERSANGKEKKKSA